MIVMELTNYFLIGFEVCSTKGTANLVNGLWQVESCEEATVVLLNGYDMPIELPPTYLLKATN